MGKKKKQKSKFNTKVFTNTNQCQNQSKSKFEAQFKFKSLKSTLRTVGSLHDHRAFFDPQTTASHYNHKSPLARGIVQITNKNYDGLIPKGYVGSLSSRSDPITQ